MLTTVRISLIDLEGPVLETENKLFPEWMAWLGPLTEVILKEKN